MKKQSPPNESSSQPEYTFEEAMKKIAQTPKSVVDNQINKAKKAKRKQKVTHKQKGTG